MKVAMVSEHSSPLATLGGAEAGGQNVYVAALSRCLAARKHHVTVYTRRDNPDLATSVEMCPGVQVVHIDAGPAEPISKDNLFPYMNKFAAELMGLWRGPDRPDIVHGHYWMSGYAALRAIDALDDKAGGMPRIPFVHTYHSIGMVKRRNMQDEDGSDRIREDVERIIAFSADQVIATCSDECKEWNSVQVPDAKLTIIPCGVNAGKFQPEGPAKDRRSSRFRVLSTSRLVPQKGVDLIVQAVAALIKEGRDVELVVVGGPNKDQLSSDKGYCKLLQLTKDLGIEARVLFYGNVTQDELPAVFRTADVVVCASWYEPFGIVPLEAMACARPVVASRCGGFLDTVVDGETGLHITPRSTDDLVDALRKLADNPDTRNSYGMAGRQRIEENFTWEQVAANSESVYRRFVRRQRRGENAPLIRGNSGMQNTTGALDEDVLPMGAEPSRA